MSESPDKKPEREFFKDDLHNLLNRYSKLAVIETVGVLEFVKWEIINGTPFRDEEPKG